MAVDASVLTTCGTVSTIVDASATALPTGGGDVAVAASLTTRRVGSTAGSGVVLPVDGDGDDDDEEEATA